MRWDGTVFWAVLDHVVFFIVLTVVNNIILLSRHIQSPIILLCLIMFSIGQHVLEDYYSE